MVIRVADAKPPTPSTVDADIDDAPEPVTLLDDDAALVVLGLLRGEQHRRTGLALALDTPEVRRQLRPGPRLLRLEREERPQLAGVGRPQREAGLVVKIARLDDRQHARH